MRRKLWPKAPAKEYVKKFSSFSIFNFQKKIYNRAKELYCNATIFVFDSLLSTYPKKMETEKWPEAADSPLLCVDHG